MSISSFRPARASLVFAFVLAALFLAGASSRATVYVLGSDTSLVNQAGAIALVRIETIDERPYPGVRTATMIRARIEQSLKGSLEGRVDFELPGGSNGSGSLRIDGIPRYQPGDRVLVFLDRTAQGTWRPLNWSLGSFLVMKESSTSDRLVVVRDFGRGSLPLDGTGRLTTDPPRDLRLFQLFIRNIAAKRPGAANYFRPDATPVPVDPSRYKLFDTPFRWTNFDDGGSVSVFAGAVPQSGVAGGGYEQVQSALSTWNGDPGSRIAYVYGGTTSATAGFTAADGNNVILFNDPNHELPAFSCTNGGVLAVGGIQNPDSFPTSTVNGTVFLITKECDVIVNSGLDCFLATATGPNDLAEVLTHEIGHTLGLGHSDDPNALMYFLCHCDGRGAFLTDDDRNGVAFVYPESLAAKPTAKFSFSPLKPVAVYDSVAFSDLSSGKPASWEWDFGDGGKSTDQNPTHTFNSSQSFNVKLTVTNSFGSDSKTQTITVDPAPLKPVASFTLSSSQLQVFEPVTFVDTSSNKPTAWSWALGDGGVVSGSNSATHSYSSEGTFIVKLTVSNRAGSDTASQSITVKKLTGIPEASFETRDSAGTLYPDGSTLERGKKYTFTDTSTPTAGMTLTGYAWNFGDHATGKGKTVTHTFVTSADSVIVSDGATQSDNGTGYGIATFSLTGIPPVPAVAGYLIPAAAHSPGVGTAYWKTNVTIFNPSAGDPFNGSTTIFPANRDNAGAESRPLVDALAPRASTTLPDVFGNPDINPDEAVSGALWLSSDNSPNDLWPIVTSVTYSSDPARPELGSYGQMIPAQVVAGNGTTAAGNLYLEGLRSGSDYRTNVGLVNLGKSTAIVSIDARSGSTGASIGSKQLALRSNEQQQFAVTSANFPGLQASDNFFLIVKNETASPVTAYASVIDNRTNDPSFVGSSQSRASRQTLAGVAAATGAHDTVWRSDVNVLNLASTDITVTAIYNYVDSTGEAKSTSRAVIVKKGTQQIYSNAAAGGLFNVNGNSLGTVTISSSAGQGFIASARTYNSSGGGTFGQWIPGVDSDSELGNASVAEQDLVALRVDGAFRTNIGIVNSAADSETTFQLELLSPDGSSAAPPSLVTVPAGRWIQKDLASITGVPAGSTLAAPLAIRATIPGSGGGFVYASVIDNVTGDPVFVSPVTPKGN